MKNTSEEQINALTGRYLAGMAIGFAVGIAIGIAMDSLPIGIAIGAAMSVSLGVAFQQSEQEGDDLMIRPTTARVIAIVVGLIVLLALAALLFIMLL
jgi:hypothetical protein